MTEYEKRREEAWKEWSMKVFGTHTGRESLKDVFEAGYDAASGEVPDHEHRQNQIH